MFTAQDFDEAIDCAQQQLEFVSLLLRSISCPPIIPISFNLRELSSIYLDDLLDGVPSGNRKKDQDCDFIYVISIPEARKKVSRELMQELEKARKAHKDYCRVIDLHKDTSTLYVGRSKLLKSRLKQHLGSSHSGTYALHLQRWAPEIDVDVSISYMKFQNKNNLLIQVVEDGLWTSLRPAFGRKGAR